MASRSLVLAKIADVIEMAGLQIGARRADLGQGRLGENLGSDILDGAVHDFMDEADIAVFTRRDPRDDLAPCDFRIDDSLAAAAAVVNHYDKILHAGDLTSSRMLGSTMPIFPKIGN